MFARFANRVVLGSAVLLIAYLAAAYPDGPPQEIRTLLGGRDRYLTHVSTDKPIYRTGETVFIRGVVLHALDRTPRPKGDEAFANVTISGPKGEALAVVAASVVDSVVGASWVVPAEAAGGEYTVRIDHPWSKLTSGERKFDVRAYRAPRMKSQIVFLREGYGPGEEVRASLRVERSEGGAPSGASVTIVARVDDAEVHRSETRVDAKGVAVAAFALPAGIENGDGTLAFVIHDGATTETASKTIPIIVNRLGVAFYPEGGDLIAGLPARVYVEARNKSRKPADVEGDVLDAAGNLVAVVKTEHEGRGRFSFTPRADGRYMLLLRKPAGVTQTFALPAVKASGSVLQCCADRFAPSEPIRVKVASNVGDVFVTLTQREIELAAATIKPADGAMTDVALHPPDKCSGVMTVTVWDKSRKPLAERLVYREPASALRLSVSADRTRYTPGSPVELTIKTLDETGAPLSATVGLTVTDDSVLEMIEKREQPPRLPVMVLLEPETRELADAHVYLDPQNPAAPLALDLLLGTQGWRRFAFVTPQEFLNAHGDAARRVLAIAPPMPEATMALGADMEFAGRGGRREALFFADRAVQAPPAAPAPDAAPVAAAELEKKAEIEANKPARPFVGLIRLNEFRADDELRGAGRVGFLQQPVAVREYAHTTPARSAGDPRCDFTETVYWHAGVRTNEAGEARVRFALSDSVTALRVHADGFDATGRLGSGGTTIESVRPFNIEPKLPLEVTAGDEVLLPIGLINRSDATAMIGGVTVNAPHAIHTPDATQFSVGPDARSRLLAPLVIGAHRGVAELRIIADAHAERDEVVRPLVVRPLGFPSEVAFGGRIEPDSSVTHKFTIPADAVASSLNTKAAVFPTPVANLTQALERLLIEPSGCFEQTSSTSYPLTMAQQYFLTHAQVDPALVQRARELLDRGYAKLAGFECRQRGYEWFGADPGHEPLTAYGLMHFIEMRAVRSVDDEMLRRTQAWLLARRDGKGGFSRGQRSLHTWSEDADCSNGYILWCLLESGVSPGELQPELGAFKAAADKSANSYVTSLAANVFSLAHDGAARKFCEKLVSRIGRDGCVDGATTSVVCSQGEALNVETTSLAALALMRDASYTAAVESCMRFIMESCKAGRYGSTQSTVLALKAIVAYDKRMARPKAPGRVSIFVDGQSIGGPVEFDEQTQDAIALPDISELLTPGEHTVELRMERGASMPYSLAVSLYRTKPDSLRDCQLSLSTSLSSAIIAEGEITEARVVVTNASAKPAASPVAIIGLPGGLEPRHDQLKELVKAGTIDAYEVMGREVVLYWRGFDPGKKVELSLSLVAAVPGTYTGPASRAYLYYADEMKVWVDPLKATIAARQ